jgi:quercetin dioxygenase-like cupin family protein
MMKLRVSILALALVTVAGLSMAQTHKKSGGGAMHTSHVMITPDEVKWGPAPPSLPPGAELAVLSGDPGKAGGAFTIRAKFPAGYKVPPHWHPTDENVVVVSGTMMFGQGTKFDAAAMHESPAGSFAVMPRGMRHFAMAKEESVVQIYGTGPFAVNYVNAADDPRKAK